MFQIHNLSTNRGETGMKKYLQTSVFVLALSTAFALAQSPSAGSPQSSTSGSDASASRPGDMSTSSQDQTGQSSAGQSSASQSSSDQKQPMVDDSTLQQQLHQQFASNPALQGVQISVNNGTATLSGSVASKDDKKEAKKLAKSVSGVKKVNDKELT